MLINSPNISGSLKVSNSAYITGSLLVSGSSQITGSLRVTGSIILNGSPISSSPSTGSASAFPFTGSAQITGSLNVTGSITTSGSASEYRRRYTTILPSTISENSFNGGGANESIFTSALQTDGKVIIGGAFTEVNSVSTNYIARLTNSGSIDSSFNIGTGFNSLVRTIAIQSDGKIVVGGEFTDYDGTTQGLITRLNSDGSIDTGFTIGSGFSGPVYDIKILSDGKIVVVGGFTEYDGVTQNYITRLNPNGSRDTSFNIGSGFNNPAYVISLIPFSTFIYVGGEFTTYNSVTQNGLIRISPNGSRDTNFNTGTGFYYSTVGAPAKIISIAVHPFPTNSINSDSLIQLQNRVVVGGDFDEFNGTPQYGITRLLSNGTRDTNFFTGLGFPYIDTNGTPIFDYNGSYVSSLAIQSDGKILIGGRFTQYQNIPQKYLIRLNQNGSYDSEFNLNLQGSEEIPISSFYPSSVNSIIIQPDNKLLFSGLFFRQFVLGSTFYYNVCIGRTSPQTLNFNQSLPTVGSNIFIGSQTINGTLTTNNLIILNLPTSDPGINGAPYNDGGFLKISSY
jgi:uncharacterized delta-60 repeat protein